MDFDSYKVLVETVREQDDLVGETTATFYENVLHVQETQAFTMNLGITITATNKCNKSSTLQVNHTLTKGNYYNYENVTLMTRIDAHCTCR